MVHPAKSWISNGIMCQDALCVCVCLPIADYVPAWIALGVDAHCVLPMVWMHKHDSEETLHGQGLNPRSVNPPIRDNSTESIRSFQEMPALHNEIQFFTISSKLGCQLSIWLKCKAHKKCVPVCLGACVPVCLCACVPKCQYWRSLIMQGALGPCSQFVGRISLVLSFTIKGGNFCFITSFLPIPPKVRYYGLRNFVSGRSQKIGHFAVSTLPIFRWWVHYADKWGINMLVKPEPSMASRGWETLKASNPPRFSSMHSSSLKTPKLGHNIANGLVEHVMGP